MSAVTGGVSLMFTSARTTRADDGPAPSDYVDPAGLRPKPEVRVMAAFLEFPRPYWLGWPGTAYDLDARQAEYRAALAESATRLGIAVHLEPTPINNQADVARWIQKVQAEKPHGVLVILQHFGTWSWASLVGKEAGVPVIIFSPIGMAFTGHVAGPARMSGVHVISSLEWSAVEEALKAIRAKRMFEETRVLWIRGKELAETVVERLGTKVRAIPRDTFNQEFDRQPVTEEVRHLAAELRREAAGIVEPNEQDTLNAMRTYTTAKRLLAREQAHALSMDCLGMVEAKLVPTPPCAGWTLLQNQGITAGCEADLYGALSLMLTSYLLDRPGFMNDPVPETVHNTLIAAHCTSGTRIAGFDQPPAPYVLRSHSESNIGVAMQVLWPEGQPVTLVRFTGPHELIVDTGKVVGNVQTPPAGGCRTSVEIVMDDIEDCRDVRGFHQVVTLGNHRGALRAFCNLYGIKMIRSPRFSTFEGGA
jgi:L-fucose isomerase-like protein